MLNNNLANVTSLKFDNNIGYNAYTLSAYHRAYKLGSIAFVYMDTIKTQVGDGTVLFTLPQGYRPSKAFNANARFVYNGGTYADRGARQGHYPLTVNTDGTITSNFNNENTYWDITTLLIYETN